MNSIINFLTWPWRAWQERKEYKRKIAEMRKRDPFIYK